MNRSLSKIAALLLVIAVAIVITKRSGTVTADVSAHGSGMPDTGISTTKEDKRGAGAEPHARPRRQSLEESLPHGSEVLRFSGRDGGLRVNFVEGSSITAAGASISERGVSFRGPYKFEIEGANMNSLGEDTSLFVSKDGRSIKAIGKTGLSSVPFHDAGDLSSGVVLNEGMTINVPATYRERGR
ncbi:MAG: hypothetical protein EOP84_08305 [Verrucomicrobiaceae bacterium]|nr:MAG: hypothetical protein EOP84_08305 [Verrucomicrobiaceae bacterium]